MEFKPNEITEAQAAEVLRKFKDYNKGVVIIKPPFTNSRNWDEFSAKWTNIIDPSYCSIRNIRDKMLELFAKIRNTPEDKVLGDLSIAFTHETDRGKKIPFYHTDMYIFCREAIKERKASEDYKSKVRELAAQTEFINKHKPVDKLLEEAMARKAQLESELDESTEVASTTDSTSTAPASA